MTRNAFHLLPESCDGDDVSSIRSNPSSSFERALATMWVAFQPIVRASDRTVFGYESLLRTDEPSFAGPLQVVEAAERLGELSRLGRSIRALAVAPFAASPEPALLFLNLHPCDLMDPELCSAASSLCSLASRVVLEITERTSLEQVERSRSRVALLREMGYRIALDDLGAGYAGLTSFALLEPEIVKLDMSLVRDVDSSVVKQRLVTSMLALARDMGLLIVAEGVETKAERDTLLGLGCDLFQGYLFARPERSFPEPSWDDLPPSERRPETPSSCTHRIAARLEPADDGDGALPHTRHSRDEAASLSVLDGLGDAVTIVNADGKIVFSNAAARRILGVEASGGGPESWMDHYGLFLPDRKTRFPLSEYPLVRALRGESCDSVDMFVCNANVPDGVLISATTRPLREGGNITGASAVFRDVTALRRTEHELERANAELHAARAREAELSAFLVHDLKSPLTAILGSVLALLDGRYVGGEDREYLTDIRDSALSMQRMVLDLLDLQTAEDGTLAPKFQPLAIAELVEQARSAMASRAAQRRQHIEIARSLPGTVLELDRELFRRVLQNLIDNCIKYGPPGGLIELGARLSEHESLILSVRDEGPGVPVAQRPRIFEKYARLERDVRGRHRDSRGLGLRFCQVAVEAHGGRIWVEDNVPKGACFSIELPLTRPQKPRSASVTMDKASKSSPGGASAR